MDTYKTSTGKVVKIAEMNPYHLMNAIKKLPNFKKENGETLAALHREQERRGGPPEDAK